MPAQHTASSDSQPSDSQFSENTLSRRLAALIVSAVFALIIGAAGCDNLVTEQVTIVIAGNPTAEFSVDVDSGCAPMTVTFSDKSSGPHDQWLWKFGDGDTASDTAPTHTYTTPGTYTVSLKITDNDTIPSASDSEVKKRFIVVGTSIAGFTMDTSDGCVGLPVTFTPTVSGVSTFSWNFGDGVTSSDTTPTHIFNTVGVFPVTLVANGACGVDSAFDTVRISSCPSFTFAADSTDICLGSSVLFTEANTDSLAHTKFTWDFGDGITFTDTVNVANHTYVDTGLFTVKLTVENTDSVSFTDSLIDYIRVNDILAADFSTLSPTFACQTPTGQYIVGFSDKSLGSITNRIWDFGDGTFDSTNNPTPFHAYVATGKFTVRLEVFGPCGAAPADTLVKVGLITLAGPLTPSFGFALGANDSTIIFTDASLGEPSTWKWNFGDGSPEVGGKSVTHSYPSVTANYNVTLTVKNVCSPDSAMVTNVVPVTILP